MPDLTLEDAIKLQDMLIRGYFGKDFQDALWIGYETADSDELSKGKARQEACLPVQVKVLPNFGFEDSKKGVQDSTVAFNPHQSNPEVILRNNVMSYLVNVPQMKLCAEGRGKPPIGIPPSFVLLPDPRERDGSETAQGTGKVWKVTGGKEKGGIVVKMGASVKSEEMSRRITTGSLLEEIERIEDRLKYQKIEGTGGGPDVGWVSIAFKGKPLVEPLWFEPEADWMPQEKDTYKVVFDPRVAKRAEPSKDAKMVGGLKKGEKVKGEVTTIGGVPWLKAKEMVPGKMGEYEDFYVMIDGTSVGLGVLLEKVVAK